MTEDPPHGAQAAALAAPTSPTTQPARATSPASRTTPALEARARAEAALGRVREAHDLAFADLVRAHGRPLGRGGTCRHAVLAVGALAAEELAEAAPLGLIFLYETDEGRSEGARGLAPSLPLHVFFERGFGALRRGLEVSGLTLDLGVRPEGLKGPLCNSLDAFVDYLERFGGPDERRALARLAFVAGDADFGRRVLDELAPFVFRRSLDAALVASLTVTSPERLTVAALVDTMAAGLGGRHPSLRAGTTHSRLVELARLGLLGAADAARLAERHEAELDGLAGPGDEALAAIVAGLATLTSSRAPLTGTIAQALDPAAAVEARLLALDSLGFRAPETARQRLDALSRHPDGPFHWRHAGREGSLAAALIEHASATPDPDQVLLTCEPLTHVLKNQPHVGAQLASDPARLSRLVRLFASDPTAARLLLASPPLLSTLVVEGHEPPGIDTAALWSAPSGERARVARELMNEARVLAAWAGRETLDVSMGALELEVVAAMFCELAEVDEPSEAPLVLLARHEAGGVQLAALLPDDTSAEVRAMLRRLVLALGEGREGPLIRVSADASRRPFSVSELERHLAEGGSFRGDWQVLAGPPHLVELVRARTKLAVSASTGAASLAPTAVMAGIGPA